jgi:hypothetical protein
MLLPLLCKVLWHSFISSLPTPRHCLEVSNMDVIRKKKRRRLCSCDHETLILSDDLCCCYVENAPTIYGAQKRFQIQWSSPAMLPACEGLYWWALNVNLSFQITAILGQCRGDWGVISCKDVKS